MDLTGNSAEQLSRRNYHKSIPNRLLNNQPGMTSVIMRLDPPEANNLKKIHWRSLSGEIHQAKYN
jgi:hypothetical protein